MKKPEELFKEHFDKFRSGLFKASLDHYLETGTLSGSMLLEVRAMFEAHDKQKLNIASVVRPEVESAKEGEQLPASGAQNVSVRRCACNLPSYNSTVCKQCNLPVY